MFSGITIGLMFIAFAVGLLTGGYVVWVVITHRFNPFE
jgi:hypothetical protein